MDIAQFRSQLSQLLLKAGEQIDQLDGRQKRLESAQSVLRMKRDTAQSILLKTFKDIELNVAKAYQVYINALNDTMTENENELTDLILNFQEQGVKLKSLSQRIQTSLLTQDNENLVDDCRQSALQTIELLKMSIPDLPLTFQYLSVSRNEQYLRAIFRDINNCCIVQHGEIHPSSVQLIGVAANSPFIQANVGQKVVVQASVQSSSDTMVSDISFLSAYVTDISGNELNEACSMLYANGIFSVSYKPSVAGIHKLYVCLYGYPLDFNPVHIVVHLSNGKESVIIDSISLASLQCDTSMQERKIGTQQISPIIASPISSHVEAIKKENFEKLGSLKTKNDATKVFQKDHVKLDESVNIAKKISAGRGRLSCGDIQPVGGLQTSFQSNVMDKNGSFNISLESNVIRRKTSLNNEDLSKFMTNVGSDDDVEETNAESKEEQYFDINSVTQPVYQANKVTDEYKNSTPIKISLFRQASMNDDVEVFETRYEIAKKKEVYESALEQSDAVTSNGVNSERWGHDLYHVMHKSKSDSSNWRSKSSECQIESPFNKKTEDMETLNRAENTDRKGVLKILLNEGSDGKQNKILATLLHEIKGFNMPIGVTVNKLTEDIIACDTRNNVVKIYDWHGSLKTNIEESFVRPSAVTTDCNGHIYVKDDLQISVFDEMGKLMRTIGRDSLRQPYGISMTSDGRIVVLNHLKIRPSLVFLSPDGKNITEEKYQPLIDLYKIKTLKPPTKCRFLTTHDNLVHVVDLGQSRIYTTDFHGNMTHSFGRVGRNGGEFNEPSGITCDSSGMLLIADSRNDRIEMFTKDGQFVDYVYLTSPIRRPSDIHLTENGYLLICNYLGQSVNVYRLETSV